MTKSVLITGGAGFIGCYLADSLLARGYSVWVLDSLHPQVHSDRGWPVRMSRDVRFIPSDVTSQENWRTALRLVAPDIVVHLAAETGTGQSLTEASRHGLVNVVGTTRMLDAMSEIGHVPERFILTSSRAVYGDGAWRATDGSVFYPTGRTREALARSEWDYRDAHGRAATALPSTAGETHPNPVNVYGSTKLGQEQILSAWARAFGAKLRVLRLQNVYGAGQAVGNPYTGVLTLFANLALAKQTIDVYEDGEIVRDFVHVEDVRNALLGAIESRGSTDVLTADIGCGTPSTIVHAARRLASIAGAPEPQISGRFRDGDVRAASCSIETARRELGYDPQWSLDRGLENLLSFVAAEKARR